MYTIYTYVDIMTHAFCILPKLTRSQPQGHAQTQTAKVRARVQSTLNSTSIQAAVVMPPFHAWGDSIEANVLPLLNLKTFLTPEVLLQKVLGPNRPERLGICGRALFTGEVLQPSFWQ